MRIAVAFEVPCPGCGILIRGEVPLAVTNYQPSGLESRRTIISPHQPKKQTRILAEHDCPQRTY